MITVTPDTHSDVGGSSAERVLACPGSVQLVKRLRAAGLLDEDSSEYADEGTSAHDVAAIRLETGRWPLNVDAEVVKHLTEYVAFVEDFSGSRPFVEWRFRLREVHPDLRGSVDSWAVNGLEVGVGDLKYGAGIPVEVRGNKQLMTYALGVLRYLQRAGVMVKRFVLFIAQPRYDHPEGTLRKWTVTVAELEEFARRLTAGLRATDVPGADLVTGKHCRWCKAKAICPKLHSEIVQDVAEPASTYSPVRLAHALRISELAPGWKKDVHQFAYREALRGRPPPGFKLVAKRSQHGGYTLVDESDARDAVVGGASEFSEPIVWPAGFEGANTETASDGGHP